MHKAHTHTQNTYPYLSLLNTHQKGDTDENIRRAFNRKLAKCSMELE